MSKPITFAATISNEEASMLPAIEFTGPIAVIDSDMDIRAACNYLATQPVIGIDTETRPSFRPGPTNRVALLQLSSAERSFLFRLNKIPLDKDILKLLEDRDIVKVGLAVMDDLRVLQRIRHFTAQNVVELQQFVPAWGIAEKSLRKISAIVLGKRVSKAQRLSNWEAAQLTDKQQTYAATDAWVCVHLYNYLNSIPKPKKIAHDPKNTPATR